MSASYLRHSISVSTLGELMSERTSPRAFLRDCVCMQWMMAPLSSRVIASEWSNREIVEVIKDLSD